MRNRLLTMVVAAGVAVNVLTSCTNEPLAFQES